MVKNGYEPLTKSDNEPTTEELADEFAALAVKVVVRENPELPVLPLIKLPHEPTAH